MSNSYWFWKMVCPEVSVWSLLAASFLSMVLFFLVFGTYHWVRDVIERRRWRKGPTYAILKSKGYVK